MSEAKKCDRCGEFYEENELMESKCSVPGSTIGGINTVTKDGRKDEHFDLCDDCVKSLFIWKNHPEFEDRWIPIDAGYPDDARDVLVTVKITQHEKVVYAIDKAQFIRDKFTDKKVWNCNGYGIIGSAAEKFFKVTAWMDLPKPYKEDTQDE